MLRVLSLIINLRLMRKINRTEKKLCKYVSKFMGKNIVAIGKYIEEEKDAERN